MKLRRPSQPELVVLALVFGLVLVTHPLWPWLQALLVGVAVTFWLMRDDDDD